MEALTELCTAEKNRLHATPAAQALPQIIRQDLQRSLRFHPRALARLTREALKLIAPQAELQLRFHLLLSIPGIAETSAVQILAELAVLSPDLDVRQGVAYAGLDPREYTSGSSVHKKTRIRKAGNAHLRRGLYMPALVAVRHDPHFRAYDEHLQERGKLKMQARVAVSPRRPSCCTPSTACSDTCCPLMAPRSISSLKPPSPTPLFLEGRPHETQNRARRGGLRNKNFPCNSRENLPA